MMTDKEMEQKLTKANQDFYEELEDIRQELLLKEVCKGMQKNGYLGTHQIIKLKDIEYLIEISIIQKGKK